MSVHLVSEQGLESVVELILVELASGLAEQSVHPVGVRSAVSESVVVDHPQSVSECLSIHRWVQCILG